MSKTGVHLLIVLTLMIPVEVLTKFALDTWSLPMNIPFFQGSPFSLNFDLWYWPCQYGAASGGTASSEELVADEGGMPSPTKRGAEARGSTEPSPTRIRTEEPPAVVEERPEKLPKVSKIKLPEPGFTDSEAEDTRANMVIRTLSDDDPMSTSSTSRDFRARIRRVCRLKSVRDVERFLKKEELNYNDDEEVSIEEFDGLDAEIDNEEGILQDYESEESPNEEVPTWSHDFDEGPPKLEEHELEVIDRQSRKTEIERLMDMKVLKPIREEQATSGSYKRLSTKIVYDWRHRDGQWKRRGRLVAREFRWLTDYDIAALFSPTGVASTVKLLSALFTFTDGYILGSVDVSDAYLQVEQSEPTVVEIDGSYYELGYTLSGQRTGSSAWFNKLQGIVEKYGLKRDEGLPALFYKLPKDGEPGIIILSHVDDLEIFATKSGFKDLVKKLEAEGLKLKVEGPLEQGNGSIGFLKRTFTATFEGVSRDFDECKICRVFGRSSGVGKFISKETSYSSRWRKSDRLKERSRHSVDTGGPPFVPKRGRNTFVFGSRETRLDVRTEKAKYETSQSNRRRFGVVTICWKVLERMP